MADSIYKPSIWVLIAGILMIIVGVYSWFHPVAALVALALYVGVLFIVAGAGYLAAYFSGYRSGWYLALGLLDIFVGIVFVSYLRQSVAALPFMFAFWCIFSGVIEISAGLQMRESPLKSVWGWMLAAGIIGVIVGFWMLFAPLAGAVAITVLLGVFLVVSGIAAIVEYLGTQKLAK